MSEVYNCRANLNKFCRPVGYESAVNLENIFNVEKVKKAMEKAKKAKNPPVGAKMSETLAKCAKRKWGADTRFQTRFIELAMKVVKMSIVKTSIDFVSSTDYDMMAIVFSEIDMVNEITLFSDKCTNKDYEKMEAEFNRDLEHRRGSYRFGLSKFIVKGEGGKDDKSGAGDAGAEECPQSEKDEKDEDKSDAMNTETIVSQNPKLNLQIVPGFGN